MKIGTHPSDDVMRVKTAREAIGPEVGSLRRREWRLRSKTGSGKAEAFQELGVMWFEEPVPADDLEGLNLIRDQGPAGMRIAAGEYGYDLLYFRRMLEAQAVDVLQADATRCEGISGFLGAAALAESRFTDLSISSTADESAVQPLDVAPAVPNYSSPAAIVAPLRYGCRIGSE